MRKLSKPWSPNDVSPEGQTSRTFAEAEASFLQQLPGATNQTSFARSEFDRLDKRKVRAVMIVEQSALCVYCERRVEEVKPSPPIDHWRPLSENHDKALHWKNLYLSCDSTDSCDVCKGGRSLKWEDTDDDLPWPCDFDYSRHVGFTSLGEIYVRTDTGLSEPLRRSLRLALEDQQDGNVLKASILNLNSPGLVAARAAAIDQERFKLNREFPEQTAPQMERARAALKLNREQVKEPFVSVRIAWLNRQLGKGK